MIRLLLAFTTAAATDIQILTITNPNQPGNPTINSLNFFSRFLVDESNMAYLLSNVSLRLDIGKVMSESYSESNTTGSGGYSLDLLRFHNQSDGIMDDVHGWRDYYHTDIQVLIVNDLNPIGLWGMAYGINVPQQDAFAVFSVPSVTVGRFTATHEIGHLQGARHDNDASAPGWARGYILPNGSDRTIMALGCGTNQGCRILHFSNPSVLFNGVPTGDAFHRDADMLNATAANQRQFRLTTNHLTLNLNEDILAQWESNHLAHQTITSSSNIVARNGSRVSMRAEASITIQPGIGTQPGLTVERGASFVAYLENPVCDKIVDYGRRFVLPPQQDDWSTYGSLPTDALHISPTLACDYVQVSFTKETEQESPCYLRVINSSGQLLVNERLQNLNSNSLLLQLDPLWKSGVYIVQLFDGFSIRQAHFLKL